jgi:hypothetical protein
MNNSSGAISYAGFDTVLYNRRVVKSIVRHVPRLHLEANIDSTVMLPSFLHLPLRLRLPPLQHVQIRDPLIS